MTNISVHQCYFVARDERHEIDLNPTNFQSRSGRNCCGSTHTHTVVFSEGRDHYDAH